MKLAELKREFDAVLSLGGNCQTAYQLDRIGLRSSSGPLDWMLTYSLPMLTELLQSRFQEYFARENIQLLPAGEGAYHHVLFDDRYQSTSMHDIDIVPGREWVEDYPAFREKLDRRIRRFLQQVEKSDSVLFVRLAGTREQTEALVTALEALRPQGDFFLLVVNYTDDRRLIELDWGLDRVCSVLLPNDDIRWEGNDAAWDALFDGITRREEVQPVTNTHSLEGYSHKVSYEPGETILFKVHSPQPQFSVEFIRFGLEEQSMYEAHGIAGYVQPYPLHAYRDGCNWSTSYAFTVPEEWPSGLYAARLFDEAGGWFYITFVLKAPPKKAKPSLVVLASTNTWQAYNDWGGASLYEYHLSDGPGKTHSAILSTQRPNPSTLPITEVGHLAGAEKNVLAWLEKQGHPYQLIADWDLHHTPEVLEGASALVINTHGEYWTETMYDALERFLNRGGSLLTLSANSVYWKTVIQGHQLEVRKDCGLHELTGEPGGTWVHVKRPEARVVGVAFNTVAHDYSPYRVVQADHWIFAGTGVKNGDLIGQAGRNLGGASGWETDKVTADSPANVELLAKGTNAFGAGAEMMYYAHPGGGGVFSAGSITFGGSLLVDQVLTKMVENVLTALNARSDVSCRVRRSSRPCFINTSAPCAATSLGKKSTACVARKTPKAKQKRPRPFCLME
ncbi:DUF1796 family putative cysteine peptidase [Tumebacillus amylolyticus]|uniref:DUF1796 family putative cysteine peptidase n=1 Tax=Tumebacillus amylolyticus TaxID=2801339 RepID=UPI0032215953